MLRLEHIDITKPSKILINWLFLHGSRNQPGESCAKTETSCEGEVQYTPKQYKSLGLPDNYPSASRLLNSRFCLVIVRIDCESSFTRWVHFIELQVLDMAGSLMSTLGKYLNYEHGFKCDTILT